MADKFAKSNPRRTPAVAGSRSLSFLIALTSRFIAAAIAAGERHACGIAEFGNLVCWGNDSLGQSAPQEGPFSALALGSGHTCAIRTSGEVFCQGDDSRGQSSPPESTLFDQISAGDRQTCGITRGGAIECWGAFPVSVPAGNFVSVNVGYATTCAHRADGYAECLDHAAALESVQDEFPIFGGAEFAQPVGMFPWPLGGLAIVERRGYVEIRPDAKSDADGDPHIALDLSDRVYCCLPELGMLGAALDPDFGDFPFIYIYYQIDAKNLTLGSDSFFGRLSRFPVTDDGKGGRIAADDELIILELPQSGFHVGGGIRFGPDGMLYASLGEGGECDIEKRCMDPQDLRTLSGKIIRLDVRGATEAEPYRGPHRQPLRRHAGRETRNLGVRHEKPLPHQLRPRRRPNRRRRRRDLLRGTLHSRRRRGSRLSQIRSEPVQLPKRRPLRRSRRLRDAHQHGDCAIIGGASLPGPDGEYVFGDYCSGRVWALEGNARTGYYARAIADLYRPITAFGTDADGAIYALTQHGPIIPIDP